MWHLKHNLNMRTADKIENYTKEYLSKINTLNDLDGYDIQINILPKKTTEEKTDYKNIEWKTTGTATESSSVFITPENLKYTYRGKIDSKYFTLERRNAILEVFRDLEIFPYGVQDNQ